jgi:oxygen-dependent protoporphyrinogen oxidase
MRRRKSQPTQKKRPRRKPTLVSFNKGIESFPSAIAEQLSNIFTNCADIQIERKNNSQPQRYSISYNHQESSHSIDCDAVVVAAPAFAAAEIVRSVSGEAADALAAIPYPPVVVVAAAFAKDQVSRSLEGFGFLIPRTEGLRMLGCVWSSSLFPGRAPDGYSLMTIFLGGATDPGIIELSDDEIKTIVRNELKKTLETTAEAEIVQIFRHRRAIPQYTIGHTDRVHGIEKATENVPGLFFAGNYLEGVSAGDCAKVSTQTAEKIWQYLEMK